MGDNLPIVNLGTDFVGVDLAVMNCGTCVLSSTAQVKCFGRNNQGQLGYGDTTTRGLTVGSMGDALPVVNIGSGFTGTGLRLATTSDGWNTHICVYEESNELLLKCWGNNGNGQLGYGDTENRGDAADEMGDDLNFVDLYFTAIAPPTSAAPTSIPTMVPSVSPTDPICDESAMYEVNWHNLVRSHSIYIFSLCTICQSPNPLD